MYLCFDVETTGLPLRRNAPITELSNWPRIVQIAWIFVSEEGEVLEERSHIIKPEGFVIPESSTKVHGISHEKAINEGENLIQVLEDFSVAIEKAKCLIAHNIDFDRKIVEAEFLREKINNSLFVIPKYCTMKTTARFCSIEGMYGYKWPTQVELHEKVCGEGFDNSHDALNDVRACKKCFFELRRRGIC